MSPGPGTHTDAAFLVGGGEMGERMRAHDWSITPLGPAGRWPSSLKTAVSIMLAARQPMFVWWGTNLTTLYNDACRPLVGDKHPVALGQPASQVWHEVWDELGWRAEHAMRHEVGTYDQSLPLIVERHGYPEETYTTLSLSPVPNGRGAGGVLGVTIDDTPRVLGDRQLAVLRELAARTDAAHSAADACALAAECLEGDARDFPFALLYLVDAESRRGRLAGACGIAAGHAAAPETIELAHDAAWPLREALADGAPRVLGDLHRRFGPVPGGVWLQPPQQAVVLPVTPAAHGDAAGVLVAGLNPFRRFDEDYRGFVDLVAARIGGAIARADHQSSAPPCRDGEPPDADAPRDDAIDAARARAALRKSEAQLERLAAERQDAEDALREADRRKDEFLATLAHELRNPLAPISYGLHVMSLANSAPDAVTRVREMMERQLRQMVRLIDDLLDVSRISRGKIDLRLERLDLSSVALDALETSRPLIQANAHRVTVSTPAEPVFVHGDATRLAQAVSNLLNNAAKYTPRGGHIRLAVARDDGTATVSVADDGVGIPAHMLGQVFDLFTQVDPSLEKVQGGLGIGLTIVRRLVELHGGSVEARSAGPGAGSEFVIRLAAAPAAPALPARRAPDDGALAPTRRILVVDDNRDSALALAMMLRMMGHEAHTAHDGLEALETAAAVRPHMILLDLGMPGLNGLETCRRVREQPWARDGVAIVAVTGWGQEEERRRSREAGFDGHLVKPVDLSALAELLASCHVRG